MLPDDLSCGEVLLSLTRETDFLIAVGSGTVTDTTRHQCRAHGAAFVSVGTALPWMATPPPWRRCCTGG